MDSISFQPLHEIEEYEKKIVEQQNTMEEQTNLIAAQERQLTEMKARNKKRRD